MNVPEREDAVVLPEDKDGNTLPKITARQDQKVTNTVEFRILREDHTAGNLLRLELLRDPSVKFAGYRLHHPLENDISIKVQTSSNSDPWQATIQAAARLDDEFRAIENKLKETFSREEHMEETQFDE
eukprot:gb/GECG01016665.1/.p1 GENE.gb/GECG01016665.1/~~gb/GECG01016665.1/.p1  ORF type:complete len:128 (+),score=23.94 gb/GECG01016665.1/:1-384(+)